LIQQRHGTVKAGQVRILTARALEFFLGYRQIAFLQIPQTELKIDVGRRRSLCRGR
jgi:hypothetical protein